MYKSVIPLSVINKDSKFQTNLLLNKKKNNLKKTYRISNIQIHNIKYIYFFL